MGVYIMRTTFPELSFELKRYIEKQIRETCDSNQVEHRATSVQEVEGVKRRCIESHKKGIALIESLTNQEKRQCRHLYMLESKSDTDELVSAFLNNTWVIVPRYITCIEKAREYRRIFT
jgi:hypothetical protein